MVQGSAWFPAEGQEVALLGVDMGVNLSSHTQDKPANQWNGGEIGAREESSATVQLYRC
jgi:hypothetical protein